MSRMPRKVSTGTSGEAKHTSCTESWARRHPRRASAARKAEGGLNGNQIQRPRNPREMLPSPAGCGGNCAPKASRGQVFLSHFTQVCFCAHPNPTPQEGNSKHFGAGWVERKTDNPCEKTGTHLGALDKTDPADDKG